LSWLETLHPKTIDLSLDRVKAVVSAMGLDRPPYRVITIGGTNGKGSCVALLESIYAEAGYRVGAFTSPHLWKFNERLRVDRSDATDEQILEIFNMIDVARGDVTLSYFEYSALAAMVLFAESGVEVALLEVGLGGRLDAVNALDPDASMIVSIDLDHQEWLGDTRESVGIEKAGILRRDRPAVIADRDPPASLLDYACDQRVPLHVLGQGFDFELLNSGAWRCNAVPGERPELPRPPFGGRVQLGNAAACVMITECLRAELPVPTSALVRGIEQTRIAARFERRRLDGVEWIFDVAHNPAAARVLADELARCHRPARTFALFAAMADKDIAGVIDPFIATVDHWHVTRADADRGATEKDLLLWFEERKVDSVVAHPLIAEACDQVRRLAADGDRVLVFGSCYMVGPAMTALGLYCAPS